MENRPPPSEEKSWEAVIEKIAPAVVVLRVTTCRSFDTNRAASSYATGFVVDCQLGLILTNRHVITPGPVVADATFMNNEEVPVTCVYRDPVHDFGFMQFRPKDL